MKTKIFFSGDFVFLLVDLIATVAAIGCTATLGNSWWLVASVWAVFGACATATIAVYFIRVSNIMSLKYTSYGVTAAWEDDRFSVNQDDFEREIESVIEIMLKTYPGVITALEGCTVYFTVPEFLNNGQKVVGSQDNDNILVGWKPNIADSALRHELGHRVLQVCGGDPTEEIAHRILGQLSL